MKWFQKAFDEGTKWQAFYYFATNRCVCWLFCGEKPVTVWSSILRGMVVVLWVVWGTWSRHAGQKLSSVCSSETKVNVTKVPHGHRAPGNCHGCVYCGCLPLSSVTFPEVSLCLLTSLRSPDIMATFLILVTSWRTRCTVASWDKRIHGKIEK